MFCRFCGTRIPADSAFCFRCGKRVGDEPRSESESLAARLHLKTPWPWAALLFLTFVGWTLWPTAAAVDMSALNMELELQNESGNPEDGIFRHYLSLVVENGGTEAVRDIPVEFRAMIVPQQDAETAADAQGTADAQIVAEFRGGRYPVLRDGESLPLVLVLTDEIEPSEKRRFPIDSLVTTKAPGDVSYAVRSEDSGDVLASLTVSLTTGSP